jgi:hypothetical protein
MTVLEKARHAIEKGAILRTLKEDYSSEMTSIRALLLALDAQNVPLSRRDLDFHLSYLEGQRYIRVWRWRDMPGYRADRELIDSPKPSTIVFARLDPEGLRLIDGVADEDPQVIF